MSIKFLPYLDSDIPAVKRLNQRLKEIDGYFSFPESNRSPLYQKDEHTQLFFEYYLAKDDDGEIRGGYYLKNQEFIINGRQQVIAFMQLPLSEGIINANYKFVGPLIFEDMEQRRKLLFVLGMGGFQHPLPKRLKKNGWLMYEVPFFFYINKPRRFLNKMEYIRKFQHNKPRKIIIAGINVFGLLNIYKFIRDAAAGLMRRVHYKRFRRLKVHSIPVFESSASELWEQHKHHYSIIAKRDAHVLNKLYPPEQGRFHKIGINRDGQCIGWVVMMANQMEGDKYFGDTKLGSIVDAFCAPSDADVVIHCALQHLLKQGIDLVVLNHSNVGWGKAFKRNGFTKGPSNFIFGISKAIKEYYPDRIDFENSFMMRGDGDGPINL